MSQVSLEQLKRAVRLKEQIAALESQLEAVFAGSETEPIPPSSDSASTNGQLSPKEMRHLAERMVASNDPIEVAWLKEEFVRGFYGDLAHA
jgi:hypothetical protein